MIKNGQRNPPKVVETVVFYELYFMIRRSGLETKVQETGRGGKAVTKSPWIWPGQSPHGDFLHLTSGKYCTSAF